MQRLSSIARSLVSLTAVVEVVTRTCGLRTSTLLATEL
jgi:hypothetical protein